MIITRTVEVKIQEYIDSFTEYSNVLLVQGARQVGKTLTCNRVLARVAAKRPCFSINLEEKPDFKLLVDACQSFADFEVLLKTKLGFQPGSNAILFIDEAQESKTLGGHVRFMKEKWPFTKCILTGSSMSRLFDKDTRIPVGRTQSVIVRPFSFREFLRAKNLESTFSVFLQLRESISPTVHEQLLRLFDEYMRIGGLPAAVFSSIDGLDFREIQASIFASQREDFYRKEKLKDHLFSDGMKAVAQQLGNPAALSHITNNHRDAKKIIEALKSWHLVVEIDQTGGAPTQKFHPKWYLYDLGILSFLRHSALPTISILETKDSALRTPLGGIMENAALSQIQSAENSGQFQNISGWKKDNKQGIEVDFIVNRTSGGREFISPIEVKASFNINSHDTTNMKHYLRTSGLKKGFIVCLERPRTVKLETKEIEIVPIYAELE